MSKPNQEDVAALITELTRLSGLLPNQVPLAKPGNKIPHVLSTVAGENEFHTFNRRMDVLFGLDCRDPGGRFRYIRRGPHGMAKMRQCLQRINLSDESIALDLMKLRLKLRLKALADEMNYLM